MWASVINLSLQVHGINQSKTFPGEKKRWSPCLSGAQSTIWNRPRPLLYKDWPAFNSPVLFGTGFQARKMCINGQPLSLWIAACARVGGSHLFCFPQPGTVGPRYVNTRKSLAYSNSGLQGQCPEEMPEMMAGRMVRWKVLCIPVAVPLHLSEPVCAPGMLVVILLGAVIAEKWP